MAAPKPKTTKKTNSSSSSKSGSSSRSKSSSSSKSGSSSSSKSSSGSKSGSSSKSSAASTAKNAVSNYKNSTSSSSGSKSSSSSKSSAASVAKNAVSNYKNSTSSSSGSKSSSSNKSSAASVAKNAVNNYKNGTGSSTSSSTTVKTTTAPKPTVTQTTATPSSSTTVKTTTAPKPTVTQTTTASSYTPTVTGAATTPVKTAGAPVVQTTAPKPTVTPVTQKMTNTGYYDANKDYAAAIRMATSETERSRLIQERQNKINAMNSAGTNTKGYTNSIYSGAKATVPQPTVTPAQRMQASYVPAVTPSYSQADYIQRVQSNIDPIRVQGVYTGDGSMSLPDQQLLKSYQKVYNDAKARGDQDAMNAAHQMAENLRDNYRYYPTANSNGYGLGENSTGFIRDMTVRTDALGNKYVDQYNRNSVTTIMYDRNGNFVNQHTSGDIAAHNNRVAQQMADTNRRLELQGKENNTYAVRIGNAADAGLNASQLAQKYGGVSGGAGQALYTTTPVTQAIPNGENLATQMYGYFDPNMDYAAAIRAETDPDRKIQLILERQNKLNYLNDTGQNPNGYSNSIYGYSDNLTGGGYGDMNGSGEGGYGSYEDILADLGSGNGGYDSGSNGSYDYSYEDFLADFPEYIGLSQEELLAQYQSIADQLAAQRNAYLQQILAENQAAQDAAALEFDEMARQAYIARRLGENALPQQLAAYGISGGGSETANLELMANYQNNLNQNERTRQQMLSDYALQALNARNAAASDISGYYANAQQNAMNAWQAEMANRNSYNQWAAEYAAARQQFAANYDLNQKQLAAQLLEAAYNQNMQNQQWQNTLAQQEYEREWKNMQYQQAMAQQELENALAQQKWQNTLAQQEAKLALQTGNYDRLAELGYDPGYLKRMQQAELQEMALQAQKLRKQIYS